MAIWQLQDKNIFNQDKPSTHGREEPDMLRATQWHLTGLGEVAEMEFKKLYNSFPSEMDKSCACVMCADVSNFISFLLLFFGFWLTL